MVGATPEVIRRHYEKLDKLVIAKRNIQRRLGAEGKDTIQMPQSLRVCCAQDIDKKSEFTQSSRA